MAGDARTDAAITRQVFDETSLHEDIIKTWGEHGAHNEVFTFMREHIRSLRTDRDLLVRVLRDCGSDADIAYDFDAPGARLHERLMHIFAEVDSGSQRTVNDA